MKSLPPSIFRSLLRRVVRLPAGILLGAIRLYQLFVSPALPLIIGPGCGCRFHPTCSSYTAQAVRVHGAVLGSWFGFRRILRCQPLHPGGFDPVPARVAPRCRAVITPTASTTCTHSFDLNG